MKHLIAICFFFLAAGLGALPGYAQTVQGTPADEQAIRQLAALHASSAQADDVDGVVATMRADADARLDDGQYLVGRDENAKF